MCPGTWQAQYKLEADTVSWVVCDLLDDLEKIEKAFLMEREQPSKRGKANPSNSGNRKMVSIPEPIPKKPPTKTKHCALYKKHGGGHSTHNMSDCCKCIKDVKIKKSFCFQAKMSELMVALKVVKTYLDDLFCITQVSLDDHLE